jgi:hypothetical protein
MPVTTWFAAESEAIEEASIAASSTPTSPGGSTLRPIAM